ncbi:hypothetical protein F8388_018401, partial [Cannabis sativa]
KLGNIYLQAGENLKILVEYHGKEGLSTMGLKGRLEGDIGGLTELRTLDLSFNPGLTGPLSPRLGDLKNLNILILAGCRFNGKIPDEIGNLKELSFLALNSNNFTGSIPASLGKLSNVYWLDLADNQLTGPLPVSTSTTPGLDQLLKAKHFHFNKNKLSGPIPERIFNSEMVLIHVLFDGNQFTGAIPSTIGHVTTLEVLRLDRNELSGEVPSNLNNLTNINELNLAFNNLKGSFPDLTGMVTLNYLDLSNNTFEATEPPVWFSSLPALTTMIIENGPLQGRIPAKLFSSSQLQQVKLKNNKFNDTLNMGDSISSQLQLVDLENNDIQSVTVGFYKETLILLGNPVCETSGIANSNYCRLQQQPSKPYSTSLATCGTKSCSMDKKLNPQSCECQFPYEGTLYFRGPSFRQLTDDNKFHELEMSLWTKLGLNPGSVSLQNPFFNVDDYLQIQLDLFPSTGEFFNRSEIQRIGFQLSNQTYKPPHEFGPYYFIAAPYTFQGSHKGNSISIGAIAGIAAGCAVLVLGLVAVAVYAIRQKKRAEKAIGLSRPFASWAPSGKDSGGAPQLKGARWFSYDELKKCTGNFTSSNEIGSGGYGKVYRGQLPDGQIVAIKRAQQGSMQGGLEFKTEIELLSRVHHKNLVGLLGFCFEQGEQMLVYEHMPNGTLRESLSGKSGIHLDWKRRLRIALGSARGLAYLHELANPPIIHRDVKTTNILLDETLGAKVADFGLSKLVSDSGKGHVSTQVKGTLGYLDPEYYMTQQLTEKSDVYSFGVVMLELITAKQPIEKGKYIVREVRTSMNRNDLESYGLKEMMDPTIRNTPILIGFGKFLDLAMQCVEEVAADRPTMSEVVKAIETILQNDGINTNSTSASSSATDFVGNAKGPLKHPYSNDALPQKDVSDSEAFDYSAMGASSLQLFLAFFCVLIHLISSFTDPNDVAVLQSLKVAWKNLPRSWSESQDPCGIKWDGVSCEDSRVTGLMLSSMGLKGRFEADIGSLTELRTLDLSSNPELTGPLSPRLGDLKSLNILILQGCGFNGQIPDELGNLKELSFLALNSNKFVGNIPASLGKLTNVHWLDLADNELTGTLPVSTSTRPGLDQLLKAQHFHFNKNKLSGTIPEGLFSSKMVLIHVLFDGNQFTGPIPSTIGQVTTLEVLRLDRNDLSGEVPSNISNLININELHLAFNKLNGSFPDLTKMVKLNYLDLSNNTFDATESPGWFSSLSAITTIIIENGPLQGQIPEELFSSPQLQQVKLKNNRFNGTLNMGYSISAQVNLVDLENNDIQLVTVGLYNQTLLLQGNPVCQTSSSADYCKFQQQTTESYSTSLVTCGTKSCPMNKDLNPQSCQCQYPYEGKLVFRGPSFRQLSDDNKFHDLERSLWTKLGLNPGAVSLRNPFFDVDDYLQIRLGLFPSTGERFNISEIQRFGFQLSNQTYKPPEEFGPYFFIADPYPFEEDKGNSISTGAIAGIASACAVLVLGLVALGVYAVQQKKRAKKAIGLSRPFASWAPSGQDSGGAPQLKGARWFSYDELKKCTSNFTSSNELGSGGYGKLLPFIFLFLLFLSTGKSGIHLDWKRRLRIALGSARGLAYLHELANPPIIHRDVKTTNILLDETLGAKVADFGLSKLVSDTGKGHVSTQVKGTLGYLDPEYYMTQQLTEKSDVYSFGVVMLELITSKQPIEKGKYIVREVRMSLNRNDVESYGMKEMIDPSIRNTPILIGFGKFLDLAMQCVEETAADRPSMSEVVKAIETILQNDGINTNSTSTSSSATDFVGNAKGPLRHPYSNDALPKKDVSDSDHFDYSGGYVLSTKIEPK